MFSTPYQSQASIDSTPFLSLSPAPLPQFRFSSFTTRTVEVSFFASQLAFSSPISHYLHYSQDELSKWQPWSCYSQVQKSSNRIVYLSRGSKLGCPWDASGWAPCLWGYWFSMLLIRPRDFDKVTPWPMFENHQPEAKGKVHKPSQDLSLPVSLHSCTPEPLQLEFLPPHLAGASLLAQ